MVGPAGHSTSSNPADTLLAVLNKVAVDLTSYHNREIFFMEKGVVKWFNDAKGYGFIQNEAGEDVFVHFRVIEADGFKSLTAGDNVEFESEMGPKGPRATRVVKV